MGSRPIHWRESGRGEAVVLLHGFPFDGELWSASLDRLPSTWRWIAPDLRGFGGSPLFPTADCGMPALADDVASLLATLRAPRAVFCGLSMGGYVCFELWRRHRSLVRALVLCDTRAEADDDEARRGRLATAQRVRHEGTEGFVEELLPRLLAPDTVRGRPTVVERLRSMMAAVPAETVARAQEGMAARRAASDLLKGIDVPCLVLGGTEDAITPPEGLRRLAAALPNARLALIPGTGHLPPLEDPQAFAAEVVGFLDSLP